MVQKGDQNILLTFLDVLTKLSIYKVTKQKTVKMYNKKMWLTRVGGRRARAPPLPRLACHGFALTHQFCAI